jgi:hypothetical protein
MKVPILSLIQPEVTGYLQTMAGHGYQITIGDGHHFIMVAGITVVIMAGSGFRIMNGDLHG